MNDYHVDQVLYNKFDAKYTVTSLSSTGLYLKKASWSMGQQPFFVPLAQLRAEYSTCPKTYKMPATNAVTEALCQETIDFALALHKGPMPEGVIIDPGPHKLVTKSGNPFARFSYEMESAEGSLPRISRP